MGVKGRVWRTTLEKIEVVKQAFEEEGQLSVRRIYYILLTKGVYKPKKNPESSYDPFEYVSHLTVKWRDAGLIDPDMIVDKHRQILKRVSYQTFNELFAGLVRSHYRHGFKSAMELQDKYVEVWIEKDTMTSTFEGFCWNNDICLVVSKGFTSYSFKYEAVKRFKEVHEETGKPVVVLYFGDFDAEGEHIPKALSRFVKEKAPELDFRLEKVLLTEEDFNRTDLEGFRIPIQPVKHERKQQYYRDFVEKYGRVKLEVEALSVAEIKDRLKCVITQTLDLSCVERAEQESKEEIEAWLKENLVESHKKRFPGIWGILR